MDFFDILLDRQTPLFHPGDLIVGKIVISLSKKVKVNKIKILLNGIANVGWLEDKTSRNDTKYVHANKNYIHLDLILIENKSMEAGRHKFPFSIKLPDTLPSSFQDNHGSISYSLKALFDIPWNFEKSTKKDLTIYSNVDLNSFVGLAEPKTVSVRRSSGFELFENNNIRITLAVDKTGFAPGEPVIFTATIQNETSKDLKHIKMNLVQNCKFNIDNESKEIQKKISTIEYANHVAKKSTQKWLCSNWILPQTCPSSVDEFDLVKISYNLELKMTASIGFKKWKEKMFCYLFSTKVSLAKISWNTWMNFGCEN
ncbi:arrestin domain-containing 3-like, partial [Brachionus plicatilis]